MAQKSNIRSMRFSDEIIQIIESQPGESFTAKFEYLVNKCMRELPNKQQELQRIQKAIAREKESLNTVIKAKETFTHNLNTLDYQMRNLAREAERSFKALEEI